MLIFKCEINDSFTIQNLNILNFKDKSYIISGTYVGTLKLYEKEKFVRSLTGHTCTIDSIVQLSSPLNKNKFVTSDIQGNIVFWSYSENPGFEQIDKKERTDCQIDSDIEIIRTKLLEWDNNVLISVNNLSHLIFWDLNDKISILRIVKLNPGIEFLFSYENGIIFNLYSDIVVWTK